MIVVRSASGACERRTVAPGSNAAALILHGPPDDTDAGLREQARGREQRDERTNRVPAHTASILDAGIRHLFGHRIASSGLPLLSKLGYPLRFERGSALDGRFRRLNGREAATEFNAVDIGFSP